MIVIVAGGRDFIPTEKDRKWLCRQLRRLRATRVITGGAKGADRFGEKVASDMGLSTQRYYAEWKRCGKSAGVIRNRIMALVAHACILFPGGKGTANMRENALAEGMIIIERVRRKESNDEARR